MLIVAIKLVKPREVNNCYQQQKIKSTYRIGGLLLQKILQEKDVNSDLFVFNLLKNNKIKIQRIKVKNMRKFKWQFLF